VFAYVDLGNKYYLNKDFDNTIKTFEEAVDFAESNSDTSISNLKYGLYNILVERSHYTGHYEKGYFYIKKYLPVVPEYRPENAFIRLNRIKIFVKSFDLQNYSLSQSETKTLSESFLKIKAYPAYIEMLLMHLSDASLKIDHEGISKLINTLPFPYKQEGYINLYYHNPHHIVKYLKMGIGIPVSNYLAYFRLNIALAQDYLKSNDSNNAKPCMKNAYSVVAYLGDIEVERHYAGIYLELLDKFPNIHGIKKIDFFMEEAYYQDRTLASNLVARDLLTEANIKIQKEQDRNFNFIIALLASLLLAIALLLFAISAYSKLKTANIYREWFSTALSHDLRSPVAEIANALNGSNGVEKAKNALISYEYLLDDTLNMSLNSQKNKKVKFQPVDLKELLLELLLDLDYLIKSKEITVTCNIDENCIVKGDTSGLKVMFRNIVLNAIKHNKEVGFIHIEQSKSNGYTLSISNSIADNNKHYQASAGTYIIDYFIKQHKAKYRFEIIDKIAVVGVGF
jgi:signal transduction histidine kinase